MDSVLAKACVINEPFPHVVIENCLPWDLYCDLLAARPVYEMVLNGRPPENNRRLDLHAAQLLPWSKLPAVWCEFIERHTSQAFWDEIAWLFGLEDDGQSTGVRFKDDAEITLDCQIGLNTPVLEECSVRGPHVDNPVEIFAGLLYMGGAQKGGDLVLYEPVKPLIFHGKAELDESLVRPVKTVTYGHNVFVGFLNQQNSIHGVTPRAVTSEPRWLCNIIAEQKRPRFELPREQV